MTWRLSPRAGLHLLAMLALAATFLGPSLELERPTYRYIFVFDISQSMNVRDIPGEEGTMTRLEYAKSSAAGALAGLPCGSEVGLSLFSGHRAFMLITPIEVCANYRELGGIIERIDWRMAWEYRSEIAKGLFRSIELAAGLEHKTRVVFLTDGQESPPINPDLPPRFEGGESDVRGIIVGVGGDTPVPIPKLDADGKQSGFWQATDVLHIDAFRHDQALRAGDTSIASGTEHLSSLRADYLIGLARQMGFLWYRLDGVAGLVAQLRQRPMGIPQRVVTDVRWIFAVISLLILCAPMVRAGYAKRLMFNS